ncbi:hypothetical protein BVY04_01765 [bacterium M21]|nr:hypothetical protein BVY04_01765 [bacterium M21]
MKRQRMLGSDAVELGRLQRAGLLGTGLLLSVMLLYLDVSWITISTFILPLILGVFWSMDCFQTVGRASSILLVCPAVFIVSAWFGAHQEQPILFLCGAAYAVLAMLGGSGNMGFRKGMSAVAVIVAVYPLFLVATMTDHPLIPLCGAGIWLCAWMQMLPPGRGRADHWRTRIATLLLPLVVLFLIPAGETTAIKLAVMSHRIHGSGGLGEGTAESMDNEKLNPNEQLDLERMSRPGKRVVRAFVNWRNFQKSRKPLYLREMTFDTFTGNSWTNSRPAERMVRDADDGRSDGWIELSELPPKQHRYGYAVFLMRQRSQRLLILPETTTVNLLEMRQVAEHRYQLLNDHAQDAAYSGIMDGRLLDAGSVDIQLAKDAEDRYLHISQDNTCQDLVEEVAQLITPGTSQKSKMSTIIQHLRKRCRYSTQFQQASERRLESFMYTTHRGHCTLFATGAAIMLRASGVPCRLAVGYLCTGWDPANEVHVASNLDRHAWLEVPNVNGQWVPLDPTPPRVGGEQQNVFNAGAVEQRFRQLMNSQEALDDGEAEPETAGTASFDGNQLMIGIGILALVIAVALLLRPRSSVSIEARQRADAKSREPVFFDRLCKRLSRVAPSRQPGQTPAEYIGKLRKAGIDGGRLDDLETYWYAVRYCSAAQDEPREAEFLRWAKGLEKVVAE